MIKQQNVIGSKEQAKKIIVTPNTVYIHENIRPYERPIEPPMEPLELPESLELDELIIEQCQKSLESCQLDESELPKTAELYIYDEIQYTLDEYIEILTQQNTELEEQITVTQLALVELFETFSLSK